jgi:hypothetical protein
VVWPGGGVDLAVVLKHKCGVADLGPAEGNNGNERCIEDGGRDLVGDEQRQHGAVVVPDDLKLRSSSLYLSMRRRISSITSVERLLTFCDRTTSQMRGLSSKIISGDSRQSENTQTYTYKHTIPNMEFKLKLIQIKCHVLEFTQDKAQNVLQRIIRVFTEAFVSHDRHTLFALEESGPPQMTYTCGSQ